jgi:hypothetical protein
MDLCFLKENALRKGKGGGMLLLPSEGSILFLFTSSFLWVKWMFDIQIYP